EDSQAGELLAATGQVEDRVRQDRQAVLDVGEPIAGCGDDRPRFHDAERESGSAVRNLIGQIVVDLPGIFRAGADAWRRRSGAIPERGHGDTRPESIVADIMRRKYFYRACRPADAPG